MKRFSHRGRAVLAAALLLAAGAAAAAERTVNESGNMPADGRVDVENVAGSVKVIGWDKAEVGVTGTLGDDVERLDFSAGGRTRIEVVFKERHRGARGKVRDVFGDHDDGGVVRDGADLTIRVPHGCRLSVDVVVAGVDISGLDGDVAVTAVSGDVDVRGACRRLQIECLSGNVEVDGAGRETMIETVSGNLKVRCDDADLQVETVSGEASVDCGSLRSLSAETVNGSITMSGRPAAGATIEAESVNGSLTLAVPADVDAAFMVTTFNGEIENAFGQKAERTDQYAPGRELKFTNGAGAADVQLNTLNGTVRILRK